MQLETDIYLILTKLSLVLASTNVNSNRELLEDSEGFLRAGETKDKNTNTYPENRKSRFFTYKGLQNMMTVCTSHSILHTLKTKLSEQMQQEGCCLIRAFITVTYCIVNKGVYKILLSGFKK